MYLHAYNSPADAKAGIDRWLTFYNETRPHQALDNRTPGNVYSGANGRRACGRPAKPTQPADHKATGRANRWP